MERHTRHSRSQVLTIVFLLLLSEGCKKTNSGGPESAAPAAPATQAAAAAPAVPPPPFSAAQKIGMFAYPKNNQSNDQQLTDEYACYTQVQQQTGINPDTAAPTGPSAAQVQAAQQQAADNAPQAQGGRAARSCEGAAGGAMVGAITETRAGGGRRSDCRYRARRKKTEAGERAVPAKCGPVRRGTDATASQPGQGRLQQANGYFQARILGLHGCPRLFGQITARETIRTTAAALGVRP